MNRAAYISNWKKPEFLLFTEGRRFKCVVPHHGTSWVVGRVYELVKGTYNKDAWDLQCLGYPHEGDRVCNVSEEFLLKMEPL